MKKKYIAMFMAVLCVASMTACGKKEDGVVKVPAGTIINGSQEEVEEKVEESTENIEESKPEETTKPEETEPTEPEVEEVVPGITAIETSGIQFSSEFNGSYTIGSYSRASFGDMVSFSMEVVGVDNENTGWIDLSTVEFANEFWNFKEYVYFVLTFEENKVISWDVIDRATGESVLELTDDELTARFFPETAYEVVEAGALPETINLSEYAVGQTYLFTVDNEFSYPNVVNDTESSLLIVSFKNGEDGDFEREYKTKQVAGSLSFSSATSNDNKLYMAVLEADASALMNADECLKLAAYAAGDQLDFDFEDFVGNNTNNTITLTIAGSFGMETELTLAPGEIIECSWMNDVTVKEIK